MYPQAIDTRLGCVGAFLLGLIVAPCQVCKAETSLTALRHQTSEQLRLAAIAKPGKAHDDAVTALCDLYVVLRSDDRYQTSDMLRGAAMKVRRRLLMVSNTKENQLKHAGIARPKELAETVDAAIHESLSKDAEKQPASVTKPRQGANAAGGLANSGWELVELIQRVVDPDFWEAQGGPGSIRYFAMRRLLVVRATTDVHQKIKDLLMALR